MCHDKGIKVVPWTVNEVVNMKEIMALGVDGLITDYPNRFFSIKD
jgi:glycerophosphoryl diester phosphodiesterase